MLGEILKKEDCASCRFCCSFRRCSLWETPIFTEENIDAIKNNTELDSDILNIFLSESKQYATYDLRNNYRTDDSEEETPCPYLSNNGCILNAKEKPWDCKIWPLRVMKTDGGKLVIALTPTCPSVNKLDIEFIKSFVANKLADNLFEYALNHPFLIKEYKDGFEILVHK